MATVIKVVPVATPAAVPVKAVQVQTVADHPSLGLSGLGTIQMSTASGVATVKPGDYIVEDGNGGYKCVPAVFFNLFYRVSVN
jgi:regulator of RNase E activity RraA